MSNSINLGESDKDLSSDFGSDIDIDWDYTFNERLVSRIISTNYMVVSGI